MTRVGFIGLGLQGGPIARRIVESGFETTLWARRPASLEPYADTAAKSAATPAELAAASDVIGVCVVNDDDVRQVVTGENGLLGGAKDGTVIIIHSTIHPDTVRDLAAVAAKQGVRLVDAPVSGGPQKAADGTLLVMIGGDDATVEEVRPVLASFANPIIHMGPTGSGQVGKLLNNLLFTANLGTAASLTALGKELDVKTETLLELLSHGSAGSFALQALKGGGGSLAAMAAVAGPLLEKDVRLVGELATAAGATKGVVMDAADVAVAEFIAHRQ